jgi:flagellar motor switch protein FliN
MTQADTTQDQDITASAAGTSEPLSETAGEGLEASAELESDISSATATASQEQAAVSPKAEVVVQGPVVVEPVPLKEITFPDTPEIQRILRLRVPLIVRLADRIMPFGEILQLAPGAIIEFSKSVQDPLDLMINNKCIGTGQAVKVGEKFGVKVSQITTLHQMIQAMGGR